MKIPLLLMGLLLPQDRDLLVLAAKTGAPIDQVAVVLEVATDELPPALLLAIAYEESSFRRNAAPRGVHKRTPRKFRRHKNYVCGVMQTLAKNVAECRRQMDPAVGYRVGVEELQQWLSHCERYGRPGMRCALTGHGYGARRAKSRGDSPYARRVIRRWKKWSEQ